MRYLKYYEAFGSTIEDSFIPDEVNDIILDIKDEGFAVDVKFDTLYKDARREKIDSYYVKLKIYKEKDIQGQFVDRTKLELFNTNEIKDCTDRLTNYFNSHIDTKYTNSVTYNVMNSFSGWSLSPGKTPGHSIPSNYQTKGLMISFRLSENLLKESLTVDDKIKSIKSFDKYLHQLCQKNPSTMGFYSYWKNRFIKIFQLTGDKFDNMVREEAVNLLYPLSLSKRHSEENIETIKDILADMEDENLIKVNSVIGTYDMNIKNPDGTLVPRYLVIYKTNNKEVWKNKPEGPFIIDGKKHYNFVYSKYDTFLGYGLKMTHVNSDKISLSEIQ